MFTVCYRIHAITLKEHGVMIHRIETTDPITGRDIDDLAGKPYVVEAGAESDLVIYFESEQSR